MSPSIKIGLDNPAIRVAIENIEQAYADRWSELAHVTHELVASVEAIAGYIERDDVDGIDVLPHAEDLRDQCDVARDELERLGCPVPGRRKRR